MISRRVSGEYCGEKPQASQAPSKSTAQVNFFTTGSTEEHRVKPILSVFPLRSSVLPVVKGLKSSHLDAIRVIT
jgi:hypothetical protein